MKKIPSEEDIILEVQSLKDFMKTKDFQMGIGGLDEKKMINKLNKIIRMLKNPIRTVKVKFWDSSRKGREAK